LEYEEAVQKVKRAAIIKLLYFVTGLELFILVYKIKAIPNAMDAFNAISIRTWTIVGDVFIILPVEFTPSENDVKP